MGVGLSQTPSLSPFFNCEFSTINTTAKAPSLPFTVGKSRDHGLPHGLWHQRMPGTSAGSPKVVQTMDINTALCRSTGHRHHHGPRTPVRSPVAAQPPGINMASAQPNHINMAPGSSTARRHQRDFRWQHRPRKAAWPQW